MKDIKDYGHLYIGCEVMGEYLDEPRRGYLTGVRNGGYECEIQFFEEDDFNVMEEPEFNEPDKVKLLLLPLSSMTEEDWKKCFELSIGAFDLSISDKIKKLATTEVLVTLGYGQYVFGFSGCDNDVRIGDGICVYLHRYLIKEELSVSLTGITESQSQFNDKQVENVCNVNHIFDYLLSKHFDLFGLIDAGIAIDKTTLK
jgi:hypothetical protein